MVVMDHKQVKAETINKEETKMEDHRTIQRLMEVQEVMVLTLALEHHPRKQ
jgi:hypothetical protein